MKHLYLTIVLIFAFNVLTYSQNDDSQLKFDTKYYDAVDRWVAFPPTEKDSTYMLGFIYIDDMAGFTFQYENTFTVKNKEFIPKTKDSADQVTRIIRRLEPNTRLVAVLNDKQVEELKVKKIPDWLENYKSDENSVAYLKQIGYYYNHVGASKNALEPLLKAYKINPNFEGLEFELGFAYNATQQFEKAVPILEKAIKENNNDQLLYKELGYALMNLKQLDKAETVFLEGIKNAKDDTIKAEMAINMCGAFFNVRNKDKYDKWSVIAKKYTKEGSQFASYLDYFDKEWAKQQ